MRTIEKLLILAFASAQAATGAEWNPKLAAEYLDQRQQEWFAWAPTQRAGGPCVSCHTSITYLMARPPLRRVLGEKGPTAYETGLLDALRARVGNRNPKDIVGTTKEPVSSQGMGVESIFAALFLAKEDEPRGSMSPQTRQAFERLWDGQLKDGAGKGAWAWYEFDTDPYETSDSPFFGATLAAMAIGSTPQSYREQEEVRKNVSALNAYFANAYSGQPLHNRLMLAWASRKLPGALSDATVRSLVEETVRKQQSDGGWTIASLGPWKEHPAVKPASGSDSYATAFTAYVLEQLAVPATDAHLSAALAWLRSHQDQKSGSWTSSSMNKVRAVDSMDGKFMSDAATSFAALALTGAGPKTGR